LYFRLRGRRHAHWVQAAFRSGVQKPAPASHCQCNVPFNTNDVVVLGTIHDYDTGFSINCDEAAILEMFCREGTMVGADIVDITWERQPNPWTSTCYRATAEFLRFKDREKAKSLVSDPWYAPHLIIERSIISGQRNREVLIGAVSGGLLGGLIVTSVVH
jgi:hypothetical protein